MSWEDRIEVNPRVLVGKPVIKGTRLAVEFVLDLIADGATEDELLKSYPGITREDVLACVGYAADIVRSERVYPLPAR